MRRTPTHRIVFVTALLVAALGSSAGAVDEAANRPVAELEIALKGMLQKGTEASFATRYRDIFRIVASTHDFESMSRTRIGAGWDGLKAEDQKALKNLLFKRVVAEYVSKLAGTNPLDFQRTAATDAEGGGGLAAFRAGEQVLLTTRLDPRPDGWSITDVRWEGRSTVAAERQDSERVLASGGVAALQGRWKERIPLPAESPASASPKSSVPAGPPRAVVDFVEGGIVVVMKEAGSLGFEGRLEKFQSLIEETHHLPGIARLAIMRPWAQLSAEQRRRFTDRFRVFSIARYASRFDGYSGERFEPKGEQDQGRAKVVNSDLVQTDGNRIRFQWVLREVDGRWRILNIVVDGISDLATKQAEYNQIFQQSGFDGLMVKLEEQIALQSGAR